MTLPSFSAPPASISRARLPAWVLPGGWPTRVDGEPVLVDLVFRDGRTAVSTPIDQPALGLRNLAGALTPPGLVEPHAHLDKTLTIECYRPAQAKLPATIHAIHEDRQHQTRTDTQRRAFAALARAAANGVIHLHSHIDWFTTDVPDTRQELARLSTVGITPERVALAPLTLSRDLADAGAIARTVVISGEGYLLSGFIHSSSWNAAVMANLLDSAARWDLDLDLHIDEEFSEVSQRLIWSAGHLSRHPFPGHIYCSHSCVLAAGSDEQAASILHQLTAYGVTPIALSVTNLLLWDATFGRTPHQRGVTLLREARAASVTILVGCDNVQDAFCPAESHNPLDILACDLFSAQFSDPFDRQSWLICDRAALTDSPADATSFAIGAATSVMIFPGSDHSTWPLNSATRLVVNHGRLTHRRAW